MYYSYKYCILFVISIWRYYNNVILAMSYIYFSTPYSSSSESSNKIISMRARSYPQCNYLHNTCDLGFIRKCHQVVLPHRSDICFPLLGDILKVFRRRHHPLLVAAICKLTTERQQRFWLSAGLLWSFRSINCKALGAITIVCVGRHFHSVTCSHTSLVSAWRLQSLDWYQKVTLGFVKIYKQLPDRHFVAVLGVTKSTQTRLWCSHITLIGSTHRRH